MRIVLRFFQSSIRFITRVVKRALAGIIWLFLDVTDLYSRFVAPRLPDEWVEWLKPYAGYLGAVTPWVVALIIVWAVLYTYYELEKQVIRSPGVGKQLKIFYSQSAEMLRRPISSDDEVLKLRDDAKQWVANTGKWIKDNMEPASLARFTHTAMLLPFRHPKLFNNEHQKVINAVNMTHQNLHALIDSQEWR